MALRILLAFMSLIILGIVHTIAQVDDGLSEDSKYTVMYISTIDSASGDIYSIEPETGEPVLLFEDALAQYPVWSPTRNELAFYSENVFIYNLDTQETINLTTSHVEASHVRWSPDGDQVAYASSTSEGSIDIFVVNRDGTDLTNLTNSSDSNDGVAGLDWSPDGDQIVFAAYREGRSGIYIINADGSDPYLLLSNDPPSADTLPVWSPTGDKIAFLSHRADGYGIYVIDADGQNLTFLEPSSEFIGTWRYKNLQWSPDGHYIVFEVNIGNSVNSTELFMMQTEVGAQQVKLTDNDRYDFHPTWIPISVLETLEFPIYLGRFFEGSG